MGTCIERRRAAFPRLSYTPPHSSFNSPADARIESPLIVSVFGHREGVQKLAYWISIRVLCDRLPVISSRMTRVYSKHGKKTDDLMDVSS